MFTLSKDALLHTEDACCALCTGILKMKSTGNKKRDKKLSEAGNKCLLFQKMHISTLYIAKDACCTLYGGHTVKPLFY
jgi:hypothetical protein